MVREVLRFITECKAISFVLTDHAEYLKEFASQVDEEYLEWLASQLEKYARLLLEIGERIEMIATGEKG